MTAPVPAARPDRMSVAVLIELERSEESGGHVKCWEWLADAAVERDDLDLTLYVLGDRRRVEPLAPHVRFVTLPPVAGNGLLSRRIGGVDASDLAPFHPTLAARLPAHDVWHLTHEFAFTGTALRMPRRWRRPIVASVHTDVPYLTDTYTSQVLARLPAPAARVVRATGADTWPGRRARARRERMLRACDRVLVSNDQDHRSVADLVGDDRVSRLRRGVDLGLFGREAPRTDPRDDPRAALGRRHGVPDDAVRVLFAGRVDRSKGALLAAEAVAMLLQSGRRVHLVLAGEGADQQRVADTLGPAATLLGRLPQAELAEVYAGCDLLAFPSGSETAGNVVGEAMSAGLPVVLPSGARTSRWLVDPGRDGVLVTGRGPRAWARAIAPLVDDPERRRRIGAGARATIERHHPSWADVLAEDLLPVWTGVVSGGCSTKHLRPRDVIRTEQGVTPSA